MRIQSHANNIRGHSSFNQLEIEMCQSHGNTAPHASAYILFETDVFFTTAVRPPLNLEIQCLFFALLNNIVLPSILNRITRTGNRSVLTHTPADADANHE